MERRYEWHDRSTPAVIVAVILAIALMIGTYFTLPPIPLFICLMLLLPYGIFFLFVEMAIYALYTKLFHRY